jgi:isopenicillin N synthase-like dioxygenase
MDTIPVIDIAPFRDGSPEQQQAVAKEVADACAALGFLIVSGHGVADGLIDEMRQVSFAYFDRPVEEKSKLRMPPATSRSAAKRWLIPWTRKRRPISRSLSRSGRSIRRKTRIIAPPVPENSLRPIFGPSRRLDFVQSGRPIIAKWNVSRPR